MFYPSNWKVWKKTILCFSCNAEDELRDRSREREGRLSLWDTKPLCSAFQEGIFLYIGTSQAITKNSEFYPIPNTPIFKRYETIFIVMFLWTKFWKVDCTKLFIHLLLCFLYYTCMYFPRNKAIPSQHNLCVCWDLLTIGGRNARACSGLDRTVRRFWNGWPHLQRSSRYRHSVVLEALQVSGLFRWAVPNRDKWGEITVFWRGKARSYLW